MPKASKAGYYAVRIGRNPGIYHTWADCETQVKGFTGAIFKKLNTEAEAVEFMSAKGTSTSRDGDTSISRSIVVSEPSNTRTIPVRAIPEDEKDCDVVYCDGACKGNGQPGSVAGIGVWWGHGDPRNISERCPGDQTNNRAELVAIVRILETTPRLNRRLLIKTDSNYSIQCVTTWIFNWMRNGFLAADGKPVKNRALIKYLAALLHARRKSSQTVEFKHVRGHVGIEGNEAADQLANFGATKPMVPERDWETLEKQVLQSLKPVKPLEVDDNDFKAYSDGLLDDEELAELFDASIGRDVLPAHEPRRHHSESGGYAIRGHTPSRDASPRTEAAAGVGFARLSDGTIAVRERSKLAYAVGPEPTRTMSQGRQLTPPSRKSTVAAVSKEELEVYASCLLSDEELSTLEKNGMFD